MPVKIIYIQNNQYKINVIGPNKLFPVRMFVKVTTLSLGLILVIYKQVFIQLASNVHNQIKHKRMKIQNRNLIN
ncbi:unnamed protein product [Paramecium sonneborni]|uniref:Transmembrane protein n=1 Tax=Paramecium sonneborni TaxID=65129 RepID=A0A8S1RSZ9_9CILI|nr:unnamed protein product [Paramecium sonneborni]